MQYTIEDILYYLEENIDLKGYNGRHRYILDRRNYLIHVLCFKFGKSEYATADILKIKRSAVHHSKYHAYHWKEDLQFKLNTERLRKVFPYNPQKSLILEYPKNLNSNLNKHFIRGYFDGDGCINATKLAKGNYSKYVSLLGTKEFLLKILEILNFNIELRKDKRTPDNINTFILNLNKENSTKFLDFIYRNSNIYLERKYKKYLLLS